MGIKQKILRISEQETINLRQTTGGYVSSSSTHRKIAMSPTLALYKAALKGDWIAAEKLLVADKSLTTSAITDGGETALHIAAVEGHQTFVSELLEMMGVADVAILNSKGCTALCFAAAAGHTQIAEIMVTKSPYLPIIKGEKWGVRPLYMAALQGFDEMARFLYPLSEFGSWSLQEKIDLLRAAIDSELYGLAMSIVDQHRTLAIAEDAQGETPLLVLARNPLAFRRSNRQGLWDKFITTVLPYVKSKTHDMNNARSDADAYSLLNCLLNTAEIVQLEDTEAAAAHNSALFFVAAESGNDDFLVELIARDPKFFIKANHSRHSIFHIAVMRRYVKVFNLIYELGGIGDKIATYIDTDGNSILHLAAKLAPQDQLNSIPGAALQMQWEVQWYKAVEKVVRPSDRNRKNDAGQKPYELFMVEHQDLMKAGEEFMKQTANACLVVTVLISTVVFTTAFTVPDYYVNNAGVLILEKNKLFVIFSVSNGTAFFSSLISMLMFLLILTSRYSNDDFHRGLPRWLVVGVAALFTSVAAMMVAFCSCLLFFKHQWISAFKHQWISATLLLLFFGTVSAMFVILECPLLVTVVRSAYGFKWLFRSYNRLNCQGCVVE